MFISTEINSYKKMGDNRAIIKLLKESGFTAYDFSMFRGSLADEILLSDDYLDRAREFRAYADSIGLPCNQTHAPFATIRKGDEEWNKTMFPLVKRAIEVSGILGARVCVVHPCNDYTAEENAAMYAELEGIARRASVKIGVENMWNCINYGKPDFKALPAACSHHDDFKRHMELLPTDVFVACLDIGHAEMRDLGTSAVEMIDALGDRLQAIHLHDVDLKFDNHALPFTYKGGGINYEPIIEAFRKNGYRGDITLECDHFASLLPKELLPAAARYAAAVADYFKMRIEAAE
ncbi:MAG: sugar phosphate isomerase/epimerase [Clostridia bacterium]|nr:sugar phosphate isomerase/epimerase [Clostridia bacterium]